MRDQIEFFMNLEEAEKTNNNRTENGLFPCKAENVDVNVNTN